MTKDTQAMKKEAVMRMHILDLHANAIKEFEDKGLLNCSERGILFWLTQEQTNHVYQFEEESGNLVYHVIHNYTEIGEMLTFLYVSRYNEEWPRDRKDLKNGEPLAYVKNLSAEFCSEYGIVGIVKKDGGLLRIF